MGYRETIGGTRYVFPDVKTLLARATPPRSGDLLAGIADGLSATAVHAHAAALLRGRVAIGDESGGLLGADIAAVLIGERPGLSAADSLGVYVTWQPAPGTIDAARNCLSNIRPQGLPIEAAAERPVALLTQARRHRMTGVALAKLLATQSSQLLPEAG